MKVLIPTDFSENAYKAVDFIYQNFKAGAAEVSLVHVIKAPASSTGVLIRIDDIMRNEAESDMSELTNYIKDNYEDTPKSIISFGYLSSWIKKNGVVENYQLIVMGTKGESNIASKLLGFVTESVIRLTQIPVIAVPMITGIEFNNVLFATDNFNFSKVDFLVSFLSSIKLQFPILRGIKVLKKASAEMIPKSVSLGGYEISIESIVAESPVQGINQYLDNHLVGLLVLFHSHNSKLDYLFNRSITKTICSNTQVPILVVPRHS